MKKNKRIAILLGVLVTLEQSIVSKPEHNITEYRYDVLNALTSSLACGVGYILAGIIASYFVNHFSVAHSSYFDFVKKDAITDSFTTIIGNDEAKASFKEIIDYLKDPKSFAMYRLKTPSGVLLYGEPGNGKTMLARAVAKESGCNFIAVSASELEDKYLGEAARKIKSLFALARKNKPCIIFIDEIDSIGRNRTGTTHSGGINQLLTEMDGFNQNERIVVMGATNIPEILDPALLRAGRFDRKIEVKAPDLNSRILLFKSLLGRMGFNVTISDDEFLQSGAITEGLSNADITQIANETGLDVMRAKGDTITFDDLKLAIEKELMSKARLSGI